jgi:hypothetical protein
MKKPLPKKGKNHSFKWYAVRFGLPGIVIVVILWNVFVSMLPRPLDGELEYIGKDHFGCYFVCDAEPTTLYVYATNLDPDEVVYHFKNTLPREKPLNKDSDSFVVTTKNGKKFGLFINKNVDSFSSHSYPQTTKKYIVTIYEKDYWLAKQAL